MKKDYFYFLSGIRGIAALLVVLRHVPMIFQPETFTMSYLAVDIFFLLSGVVIEAAYQERLAGGMPLVRFAWIRIARVYPLYILGTLITLLAISLSLDHVLNSGPDALPPDHEALSAVLAVFMLPKLNGGSEFPFDPPAWSLFFELIVNVVYATILPKLTNGRLHLLAAACGLGLFLSVLLLHRHYGDEMGWDPHTFFPGFFRTGWSFFTGVAIYRFNKRHPLKIAMHHPAIIGSAILIVVTSSLMFNAPRGTGTLYYDSCVFLLFPAIIYASLSVQPGKFVRPIMTFLGDTSYAVYTLHVPLYIVLCSVVLKYAGLSAPSRAQWQVACFIATLLLLAHAADKLFDRPAQKFLKRLWWNDRNSILPPVSEKLPPG